MKIIGVGGIETGQDAYDKIRAVRKTRGKTQQPNPRLQVAWAYETCS